MGNKLDKHLEEGYEVDISQYVEDGWEIFKSNVGGYLGFFLLYIFISSILTVIPGLNFITSIFISPCLVFGFYLVAHLSWTTRQAPPFEKFFGGFKHFRKVVLIQLIMSVVAFLCVLPAIWEIVTDFIAYSNDPEALLEAFKEVSLPLLALGIIAIIYLTVSWSFAGLIAVFNDKEPIWALELSRKLVAKNFGMILLFFICVGVIMVAGILFFFVGILLSYPLGLCIIYAAYSHLAGEELTSIEPTE